MTTLSSPPNRHEVHLEDTWDLSLLFPTDEAWEEEFQRFNNDYLEITQFEGSIGSSAKRLLELLECEKKLHLSLEKLSRYAGLRLAEDSAYGPSLEREGRLQALAVKFQAATSFIAPEIQAIEEEAFSLLLTDTLLTAWTIPLKQLRRLRIHTLSQKEEQLLALSQASLLGHEETFSQLTNVDMIFGTLFDENNQEVTLTQSNFSSLLQRQCRTVRQEAFDKFYQEFSAHRYTLASTLASSVKSDVFYAQARHYPSALEAALFENNIPISVYENLITTVRSRREVLFEYYDLRERILKLPQLHAYDLSVPLVASIQSNIPFDDAIEKVLRSLEPLGSEYVNTLESGLKKERWCDRYENKGKRSGAFSSGGYEGPPYILMNYKSDTLTDLYTLTHEAGHSMHTWYSCKHQSFQNYHYPIFLAEVASTFNEILLTEYLLSTTDDLNMRAYIINRQIDDLRGTLFRQTLFAEFEKITHAAQEAGEALTLDFFRRTYRTLLHDYFGPRVIIDEALELECLRIPHFYHAFYVYQYATGISAAVALASEVLKSGQSSQYLNFLKSGNSQFPLEALQVAGVDISTTEPISLTLDLFAKRLQELQELI